MSDTPAPAATVSRFQLWLNRIAWVVVPGVAVVLPALVIRNAYRAGRDVSSECQSNLKSLCIAELKYIAAHRKPSTLLHDLDWSPDRGNRYTYFTSPTAPIGRRNVEAIRYDPGIQNVGWDEFKFRDGPPFGPAAPLPDIFAGGLPLGTSGACPDCATVMACASDLHINGRLDIWSVATVKRRLADATVIDLCEPYHERDGLTEPPQ